MKIFITLILYLSLSYSQSFELGKWNKQEFEAFLLNVQKLNFQEKSRKISQSFLGIPYKSNTLHGSNTKKEKLIINLSKVDCFTFLDYVESMKRSRNFEEFKKNLVKIRYQSGEIQYTKRNHFFSDWIVNNNFKNITSQLSNKTQKVVKYLNQFQMNKVYLNAIEIKKREIEYLDSKFVNEHLLSKLKTGDYIGIYTHKKGLDVTHTGIIVKKGKKTFLRHASSKKKYKKVVDEPFFEYIKKTPGFFVLR